MNGRLFLWVAVASALPVWAALGGCAIAADESQNSAELLSSGSFADWYYFGPEGSHSEQHTGSAEYPIVQAFHSPDAMPEAWRIHANIPLAGTISQGDRIVVEIVARGMPPTERGEIAVRLQSRRPPYDGYPLGEAQFGGDFALVRLHSTATLDLAESDAIVTLNFAGEEQDVQVANVDVWRLAAEGER